MFITAAQPTPRLNPTKAHRRAERYFHGYPDRIRREQCSGAFSNTLLVVVMLVFWLLLAGYATRGAIGNLAEATSLAGKAFWSLPTLLTVSFLLLFLWVSCVGLIYLLRNLPTIVGEWFGNTTLERCYNPRIFPEFERGLCMVYPFRQSTGIALARHCEHLDALARAGHTATLSSLGLDDDLLGPDPYWRDPDQVRYVLASLREQIAAQPPDTPDHAALLADLDNFDQVLASAARRDIRCRLMVQLNANEYSWALVTA